MAAARKPKLRLRVGDLVVVISGTWKGESGKVLRFTKDRARVFVEGVNKVKRHQKPVPAAGRQGGIIEKEASIHVSNVAFQGSDGKPARIGWKVSENGEKVRVAKKTGEALPDPRA